MRWLGCLVLAACTPTFPPPPGQAPQIAHDAFQTEAYPQLLAHYGFGTACASIAPATTFPALLCSPDPYDQITTDGMIFTSYGQAEDVLVEGAPPSEVLPWQPGAARQVIDWLDLEDAACRWPDDCPSSIGF
ncbi:MAG TPA: hypothetical protein VGF94_00400 [Kofleriaceae bacterium]|jgi:hypothetical protein